MTQIILKNDLNASKVKALLAFLKSWNIDAELRQTPEPVAKPKSPFSLAAGLWADADIDAKTLREKAWSRRK